MLEAVEPLSEEGRADPLPETELKEEIKEFGEFLSVSPVIKSDYSD